MGGRYRQGQDVKDIPEHALSAIKRVRILKDGTLDIEMVDKVRVLQMLAKSEEVY